MTSNVKSFFKSRNKIKFNKILIVLAIFAFSFSSFNILLLDNAQQAYSNNQNQNNAKSVIEKSEDKGITNQPLLSLSYSPPNGAPTLLHVFDPLQTQFQIWNVNNIEMSAESAGFSITNSTFLPANYSSYNVIVFNKAVNSSTSSLIEPYVKNGGGIVFFTSEIYYMGDPTWTGASSYANAGGDANTTIDYAFNSTIQSGVRIYNNSVNTYDAAYNSVDANSTVFARWASGSIFAYNHTYFNGRVAWYANNPGTQRASISSDFRDVFAHSLLWLSTQTTQAINSTAPSNNSTLPLNSTSNGVFTLLHVFDPLQTQFQVWNVNNIELSAESAGFSISNSTYLPANYSSYNVIVFNKAVNSSTSSLIEPYVKSGGAVVFFTSEIYYMGDPAWTGASSYANEGGDANTVTNYPFNSNIPSGVRIYNNSVNTYDAAYNSVDANSTVFARWASGSIFAYNHTYFNGRVIWYANNPGTEREDISKDFRDVFAHSLLWLSNQQTKVLNSIATTISSTGSGSNPLMNTSSNSGKLNSSTPGFSLEILSLALVILLISKNKIKLIK